MSDLKDLEFELVHVKRDIIDIRDTMSQQEADRLLREERWYEITDRLTQDIDKFLATFTAIKWSVIGGLILLLALNHESLGDLLKTLLKIAV